MSKVKRVTKANKDLKDPNLPKRGRGGSRKSKAVKNVSTGEQGAVTQVTISANECRIPFKSLRIEKNEIIFTI